MLQNILLKPNMLTIFLANIVILFTVIGDENVLYSLTIIISTGWLIQGILALMGVLTIQMELNKIIVVSFMGAMVLLVTNLYLMAEKHSFWYFMAIVAAWTIMTYSRRKFTEDVELDVPL